MRSCTRPVAASAVVAVALALVGGAAAAPTPGATLRSFVAAAGRGDAGGMWRLLTPASQKRLGPLARFRAHTAVELADGAGTFARAGDLRVVLDDPLGSHAAVAAVAATRRAEGTRSFDGYAVALRAVGHRWRIELGSRIALTPLGAQGRVAKAPVQFAVGARSRAAIVGVAMWVDGRGFPLKLGGTGPKNLTAYGAGPRVGKGKHVVVAWATTATGESSAVAWTFTVR